MIEKDLINKLAEFKKIKPNQDWVVFCRKNLVQQMESDKANESSVLTRLSAIFKAPDHVFGQFPQFKLFLRPATVLAVVFILIFGSGLTAVFAARTSLPGDRLYSVKIALEQAQLLITPSQEGKTNFQSGVIASRLQELDKVVNAGESIESKQPKIEEAMNNLQRQLLTVKDELPKLDGMEAKKAVEMAKKIDANASQAQQALSQAKLALSPEMKQNLNEKINEVADEADRTSNRALEVMIKNQDEGGGDIHKEILAKLDEKIQKTEDIMKSLATDKLAIGKEFSINAAIILDETDKAIEQARLNLRNDDMEGALQTIKAANELVKSAQKIVEAENISDSDKSADTTNSGKLDSEIPSVSDNASSTPSVATSTPAE